MYWTIQKKKQNIPGILLFIDFEKAFDSLDWNFMLKCLTVFGFGPSLMRWIEKFYTNISSWVLNNDPLCSQYFEVQRGVRQGDPLSPCLFIIAAEILAIAIQTNTDTQGLKIGKEEFKLVQYADDLTVFVPNVACAQLVFHLLDKFRFCSCLKVNYTKTEAIWIGSSRDSTATPLVLTWRGSVKAFNWDCFHLKYNCSATNNFYDKN